MAAAEEFNAYQLQADLAQTNTTLDRMQHQLTCLTRDMVALSADVRAIVVILQTGGKPLHRSSGGGTGGSCETTIVPPSTLPPSLRSHGSNSSVGSGSGQTTPKDVAPAVPTLQLLQPCRLKQRRTGFRIEAARSVDLGGIVDGGGGYGVKEVAAVRTPPFASTTPGVRLNSNAAVVAAGCGRGSGGILKSSAGQQQLNWTSTSADTVDATRRRVSPHRRVEFFADASSDDDRRRRRHHSPRRSSAAPPSSLSSNRAAVVSPSSPADVIAAVTGVVSLPLSSSSLLSPHSLVGGSSGNDDRVISAAAGHSRSQSFGDIYIGSSSSPSSALSPATNVAVVGCNSTIDRLAGCHHLRRPNNGSSFADSLPLPHLPPPPPPPPLHRADVDAPSWTSTNRHDCDGGGGGGGCDDGDASPFDHLVRGLHDSSFRFIDDTSTATTTASTTVGAAGAVIGGTRDVDRMMRDLDETASTRSFGKGDSGIDVGRELEADLYCAVMSTDL